MDLPNVIIHSLALSLQPQPGTARIGTARHESSGAEHSTASRRDNAAVG